MAKFVIDRSKWRCGGLGSNTHGMGVSRLLNSEGFMCCLGHCAKQLGANEEKMLGAWMPHWLKQDLKPLTDPGGDSSALSMAAASINDDYLLTDAERESKLTTLFAEHGHEIEFTGEFATA